MDRYLIGVDIDGTLLTSEKELTYRTRKAIEEAARKGNVIVPVTGRPLSGIPESILECKEIEYIITSNGAVIYDLKKDRIMDSKCLPLDACKFIYNKLYDKALVFEVFIEGVAYETEQSLQSLLNRRNNRKSTEYLLKSRKVVQDPLALFESGKVDEILALIDEKYVDSQELCEVVRSDAFQAVETMKNEFEMYNVSAGKGNSLIYIGDMLGFTQEKIIAIGDSNNDLDMMEKAGVSIAMGNALDSVKKIADRVTASNDQDGVAKVLERLWA